MTDPLYEAVAIASETGREGHVETNDGRLSVDLAIPTEVGGPGGPGTNPEQLFAAGYAACFTSAVRLVARKAKRDATGLSVAARIGLHRGDNSNFKLSAQLDIHLPQLERADAEDVVNQAHQVCPYSNATRDNIDVVLRIVETAPA